MYAAEARGAGFGRMAYRCSCPRYIAGGRYSPYRSTARQAKLKNGGTYQYGQWVKQQVQKLKVKILERIYSVSEFRCCTHGMASQKVMICPDDRVLHR